MIYLDNAASSYPKPPQVIEAVAGCLREVAASPGRGQHKMALKAGRIIRDTRLRAARLLGAANPSDLVFTANATEALNLAIMGWIRPGDRVVTTWVEHNSVYRPLAALAAESGVAVELVRCDEAGRVDVADWRRLVTVGTRLAIFSHASNVLGTIQPLEELVGIAKEAGVPVLIDAAQSAGAVELDIEAAGIDMLAFTGHKALLGPQGTGGLYISPSLDLTELKRGGTGTGSKGPQPLVRPDRYESGTYNTPGLAGLGAALVFLSKTTVPEIFHREQQRIQRLLTGLMGIERLEIHGPAPGEPRASLVSVSPGWASAAETAAALDRHYDIYVRSGGLCAPKAHELIGTETAGVLRLSPGHFSTDEQIDEVVAALGELERRD